MPSPFPGMNPWLESPGQWQDFHNSYILELRRALVPGLGDGYYARIEAQIYIHEHPADSRRHVATADLAVMRDRVAPASSGARTAVLAGPQRVLVPLGIEEIEIPFIVVHDRRNREVVTVIELLSPSNKNPGADRGQYEIRRRGLLRSAAHFVEIDLLRGGPKMPTEPVPECDYGVLVSRREERPGCAFWPVGLRERLPVVPIPLREPGEQVPLDLQAALHAVYDAAGYEKYLYEDRPTPPLSAADAEWAAGCLRSAGVGTG